MQNCDAKNYVRRQFPGQRLQVGEEVLLLRLEELSIHVVAQRLVPEGPDVDPGHFGGPEDLAQGPHERPVDAHQLLVVDHVGLVEYYPASGKKGRIHVMLIKWLGNPSGKST